MKKILLTILATALFLASYAKENNEGKNSEAEKEAVQVIDFKGSIIDHVSSEALVGVEVQIEGTDIKAYTDFDGNFTFENLKPGKYNIIATYISYEKNTLENVEITRAADNLKIELEASK
ncbi:MAG: carboxypeptidase-like regulatory domain-containing protein [Prolixibacteraceae bacterium]|nr:carboxypeptidase-like regulatory domain-containing protein [Prolixibacteraceae bacterium]